MVNLSFGTIHRINPKLKNLDEPTFGEQIMEIGEAPVVLDTFQANSTVKQIKKYCQNNGFFNCSVRDSVVLEPVIHGRKKEKRAHVYYIIESGRAYKIRNLKYRIDDEDLAQYVFQDTSLCKLKTGQIFQTELFSQERERIYKNLLNIGYY